MFSLIKTKGCQRCGGDLFLEQDEYGFYAACIQCGGVHTEYSHQKTKGFNLKQLVEVGREDKTL